MLLTHYRLCLFCPLALLAAVPLTELLLGLVSESGGSFRFSKPNEMSNALQHNLGLNLLDAEGTLVLSTFTGMSDGNETGAS